MCDTDSSSADVTIKFLEQVMEKTTGEEYKLDRVYFLITGQ